MITLDMHDVAETDRSANDSKSASARTHSSETSQLSTTNVVPSHASSSRIAKKSDVTTVVFVAPENAKVVKKLLESRGWLDKGFRMSKMTTSPPQIAVPIVADAWEAISGDESAEETSSSSSSQPEDWSSMILGHGQEEMPFSTARYAAKGKR
jgi:hypothetical protein